MSERASRWVLYVVAGLVAIRWLLVGAAQLPSTPRGEWAAAAAIFLCFILWARSRLPVGDHPLIRRDAGFLMVVFAPIAAFYYLYATRRTRPRGATLTVAASLVAPGVAYTVGALIAAAVPVPPRYVRLAEDGEWIAVTATTGTDIVRRDHATLAEFLLQGRAVGQAFPADGSELYARWYLAHPSVWRDPFDPFTGRGYLYEPRDSGFVLWSRGPDRELGTADDVWYQWPEPDDSATAGGR